MNKGVHAGLTRGPVESFTGIVVAFAGTESTVQPGWLLCYGQTVSRVTYKQLFDVIGTTYGVGDGASTFAIPDLRGKVPVGLDNMGGTDAGILSVANTLGATGGAQTHTLVAGELASHTHPGASGLSFMYLGATYYSMFGGPHLGFTYASSTGSNSGGSAHNNMQPYILMNYIIKT